MPLTYLLDTNSCIYITKQKPMSVLAHFERLQVGDVAMSLITYGELLYGAQKSRLQTKVTDQLEALTHFIPPLPLSTDVAKYYGQIRGELEKKGMPIGNNELWIAAHALSLKITLVTNNEKEFQRIANLKLENWCE